MRMEIFQPAGNDLETCAQQRLRFRQERLVGQDVGQGFSLAIVAAWLKPCPTQLLTYLLASSVVPL